MSFGNVMTHSLAIPQVTCIPLKNLPGLYIAILGNYPHISSHNYKMRPEANISHQKPNQIFT